MNAPLKIGLASVLALSTALPAFAQQYQPQYPANQYQRDQQDDQSSSSYRPTDEYQQQREQYQQERQSYEARKDAYDARRDAYRDTRADYRAARADYERRRANWERARADYDRRYGYGAYIRVYGPEPVWDSARWARYEPSRSAGYYGRDTAYTAPVTCRNDHSSATAGAILGALAGAALGSNIAASGVRTEGAVLGGVVGAGIGGAVGNAHDRYLCDSRGPYFSYNATIPYREARDWRAGRHDYAYYNRMRCRLAAAPVDRYGRDYRYVRVCPDDEGRYRITG